MYRKFNSNNRNPKRNFFRSQKTDIKLLNAIHNVQVINQANITQAEEVYTTKYKFEDFAISNELKSNVINKYQTPTPIQDQAIPPILEGKDVIGIANTGTGKTAAFLIPLIDKVFKNRMEKVLIVTPTRELALQINDEFKYFAKNTNLNSVLCIGGTGTFRQIDELRRNPNFVIGTPGRIKDVIQRRALNLSSFQNVVLDEADRMVDIGFINDIKYFISLLPKIRQSLFFSATVSPKVQEIIRTFVVNPVTVSVKQQDTAINIDQNIIKVIDKQRKVDQLHDLLRKDGFDKILIFGRTKHGVQKLADNLIKRGFKAGAIHGNKKQNQRQRILDQFKNNEINILLATDVASRGLDIADVSHVINYDLPASYDDYVHRIGRTGRANKKGVALTFVE
jgi:ATP-dependent RNA helicase RhlE